MTHQDILEKAGEFRIIFRHSKKRAYVGNSYIPAIIFNTLLRSGKIFKYETIVNEYDTFDYYTKKPIIKKTTSKKKISRKKITRNDGFKCVRIDGKVVVLNGEQYKRQGPIGTVDLTFNNKISRFENAKGK